MLIDRSHRPWAVASLGILVVASAAYLPYAVFYPGGPRGNSVPGLIYGGAGYAMMLFAALLGARKKKPLWRIGRAKAWMRGHLWLGTLSLPILLFHASFRARGPLAAVIMALLFIVVVSGILGTALQQFLPRRMMTDVPLETIYEQIPLVREELRAEATAIFERLCAEVPMTVASGGESGHGESASGGESEAELSDAERTNLRQVYTAEILPFLRDPESGGSPLAKPQKAQVFFEALRRQSSSRIHESLNDLESICAEERQLTRQGRMYFLLHGWLLVHVPLAITLVALGAVHAFVSLHY
jgi:hypothetical protein